MPENPYYDHATVRNPGMLFGREQLFHEIYSACLHRQSFSLVGTRFIGKSSILSHISSPEIQQRQSNADDLKRLIFIFIDMRDYLQHSLEEFFNEVVVKIRGQVPEGIVLPEGNGRGWDIFSKALQKIHEENYHTVLLMDTFDKVAEERQFGPNFFTFLRSPASVGTISYITTSIKPLYEISPSEAASPLFSAFRPGAIGALTQTEARQLITIPAERAGQPFNSKEVDWLLEQAGAHPCFLQRACQHLFEAKSQLGMGESLDYQKIRQEIASELEHHFEVIWRDLDEAQKEELGKEGQPSRNIARKVEYLRESGLFRGYLNKIVKKNRPTLEIEEVREALDHLNERNFLQNCVLAKMQYIETRDADDKATVNKRGLLVQEFLRTAYEQLKPAGVRSDGVPEWRAYNILYYCYFKHQLENEKVAARLGISRRQFFREKKEAIDALIQVLLKLDEQVVE